MTLQGAGDGVRTHDIQLGKLALYQLSYPRAEPRQGYPETSLRSTQGFGASGVFIGMDGPRGDSRSNALWGRGGRIRLGAGSQTR